MSISATIFDSHAEVTVRGRDLVDFNNELDLFRDLFDKADRTFDPDRKVWIIKPYQKYMHLECMQIAMENRRRQLTLFPMG